MTNLNRISSISLYLICITSSVIFAYYTQKHSGIRLKRKYWIISFLFLWIPVAFRASGVDHISYVNMFKEVQESGSEYFKSYSGSPEPFFILLVYIVVSTFNKFQ